MFEVFTDSARRVLALANQEARRFNHEYIGTEHILLGLVKEGSGVGATVLKNLDIDLRKVRLEVEKLVKSGPDMVTMGKLPQTPRAKKALEYAIEESRSLDHNYIGSEHLLLGLLREKDGVAAAALSNLGLTLEAARAEVAKLPKRGAEKAARGPIAGPSEGAPNVVNAAKLVAVAAKIASELRHSRVNSGHLVLAMMRDPECLALRALRAAGTDPQQLEAELLKLLHTDADKP